MAVGYVDSWERRRQNRMAGMDGTEPGVSRRDFLRAAGVAGALGVSGSLLGARAALGHDGEDHGSGHGGSHGGSHGTADTGGMSVHGGNGVVGEVDLSRFDPSKFLREFYWGEERREGGRTVREYELTAEADRKSTRLNSSHLVISYAVFCLKKKTSSVRLKASSENDDIVPSCRQHNTHS